MLDLLNDKMQNLGINDEQKDFLRTGLKSDKFSKAAKTIA